MGCLVDINTSVAVDMMSDALWLQGVKMSKSIGNVTDPLVVIEGGKDANAQPAYGADVLRLWAASVDFASDVLVGPKILEQVWLWGSDQDFCCGPCSSHMSRALCQAPCCCADEVGCLRPPASDVLVRPKVLEQARRCSSGCSFSSSVKRPVLIKCLPLWLQRLVCLLGARSWSRYRYGSAHAALLLAMHQKPMPLMILASQEQQAIVCWNSEQHVPCFQAADMCRAACSAAIWVRLLFEGRC